MWWSDWGCQWYHNLAIISRLLSSEQKLHLGSSGPSAMENYCQFHPFWHRGKQCENSLFFISNVHVFDLAHVIPCTTIWYETNCLAGISISFLFLVKVETNTRYQPFYGLAHKLWYKSNRISCLLCYLSNLDSRKEIVLFCLPFFSPCCKHVGILSFKARSLGYEFTMWLGPLICSSTTFQSFLCYLRCLKY